MYRDYRTGKFKSKKNHELGENIRLYMTLSGLTLALMFGFALQPTVWTYTAPIAQAFESLTDLCELDTVTCGDEKVDQAVLDIPHESPETEKRIRYLYEQAEGAGLDADHLAYTIYCESAFHSVKSYIDGEESYGLAQIHLPSHPSVTKEQALDAYFSIDWMIEHWHDTQWFGFDRNTLTCANSVPEYWLD